LLGRRTGSSNDFAGIEGEGRIAAAWRGCDRKSGGEPPHSKENTRAVILHPAVGKQKGVLCTVHPYNESKSPVRRSLLHSEEVTRVLVAKR